MNTPQNSPANDLDVDAHPNPATDIADTTPKQFCPLDVTKASLNTLQERAWVLASTALELIVKNVFEDDPTSSNSSTCSSEAPEAPKVPGDNPEILHDTPKIPDDINLEPKESRAIIVALLDAAISTPLSRNVFKPRAKCSTCEKPKWSYSLVDIEEDDPEANEELCTCDYDSEYESEEEDPEEDQPANDIMESVHFCPTLPIRDWNGETYVEKPCIHEARGD